MIIKEKKSWLRMVFAIRGSALPNIWPRIVVVLLVSVITVAASYAGHLKFTLTPVPFTVVGLAIAIFLGFRNNAAYDRYWEGRKLWGALVNVSRNFAIQSRVIKSHDNDPAARERLIRMIIGYVHCLRHRLRKSVPDQELNLFLGEGVATQVSSFRNIPVAILDKVTELLVQHWRSGNLETYQLNSLQADLSKMLDVQGGCERIQATPIPFTYSVLTHRTVVLYCLALPFGLHDTVGWATPFVAAFVSYAFFALDDLGDEIEQPFGLQPNSLPLHAITRTIEIDLLTLAGTNESDLPDPIVAIDNILY